MGGAATFAGRVREVYRDDLARETGVVHVTSVWASPDGAWQSLQIGPAAPESPTDAFVLDLARARADAIVTTGAILRAEPELRHTLTPDAAAWRAEQLEKHHPPTTVVLTRRADLDLDHPLLATAPSPVVVVTASASAATLAARALARGCGDRVDIAVRQDTGLRDVVAWLGAERRCRTIVVESGVSTSRALYDAPAVVDELMLSIYCEAEPPRDAIAGLFLRRDDPVRALLDQRAAEPEYVIREESGEWRFRRYRLTAATPGR